MGWLKELLGSQPKDSAANGEAISPPLAHSNIEEEKDMSTPMDSDGATWKMQVSPENYLKKWPNGPEAKLALKLTQGVPDAGGGIVRFFSPRSSGLQLVVESIKWHTTQTPGGNHTTQTSGIRVEFDNGYFQTDDPRVIDYLTKEYKDKRFPVVRTDMQTASAHTQ